MNDVKLTLDMEVQFYISIGFQSTREERFTIEQLGFDESDLEDMTNEEIYEEINKMQEEWTWNYIDQGWYFD